MVFDETQTTCTSDKQKCRCTNGNAQSTPRDAIVLLSVMQHAASIHVCTSGKLQSAERPQQQTVHLDAANASAASCDLLTCFSFLRLCSSAEALLHDST